MRGEIVYRKILVPMDGSEPSKQALKVAIESASKWGAELQIVSVIPPVSALLYGTRAVNIDEYEQMLEKIYIKVLDEAKDMVKEDHPELEVSVSLLKGHVPSTIIKASDSDDIDLIVMGSRGLSGIKSWFLGSVSKNVVEHCKKPILIVK